MADEVTKPLLLADSASVRLTINKMTGHLDVQIPEGNHFDVDGDSYVEIKADAGRVLVTRRPLNNPGKET
jgi:hypothetical protein